MNGLSLNYKFQALAKLTNKEVEKIVLFDNAHFPWPWTEAQWLESSQQQEYWLGSTNEGEKIACFSLYKVGLEDSFSHLLKIMVSPNVRKLGVAKKHLGQDKKQLELMNIKEIYLEVESDNLSAIELYQSTNFSNLTHKKNFYGNGRHAESMACYISKET